MNDCLRTYIAVALSVIVHVCIALFGDISANQPISSDDGQFEVTLSFISDSNMPALISESRARVPIQNTEMEKTNKADAVSPVDFPANKWADINRMEQNFETEMEQGSVREIKEFTESQQVLSDLKIPSIAEKKRQSEEKPLREKQTKTSTNNIIQAKEYKTSHTKYLESKANPANAADPAKNQRIKDSARRTVDGNSTYVAKNNTSLPEQFPARDPGKQSITVSARDGTTATPLYYRIPKPPYPSQSRNLGEQGTVIIAVLVDINGHVKNARISKSSGYPLLDDSALSTVRKKWLFKPGTRNGIPVESRVRIPIKFGIRN